jgi:predicted Fe-Mo cluster-binding NifX family protein
VVDRRGVLPAAIRDGFFAGESSPAQSEAAKAIARMPVEGTLVAAPGMPASRMLAQSTLRVRRGATSPLLRGARYGGAAIFDYRVAGTATTFHRCRYYYITSTRKPPNRIEEINVGISAEKLTKTGLEAAERQNRAGLRRDGWRSRDGRSWVRGNVVLDLRVTRLDDAVRGEDPARAGEWIEYVELHSFRS